MAIFTKYEDLIGNTPLVELQTLPKAHGAKARILAKLEYFNPASSVKDRAAWGMISNAIEAGKLTPGAAIVEPTSGNTGIGLAAIAAAHGYKVILTMPASMSVERRNLLAAYGATLVLTPPELGMQGAVDEANRILETTENAILAGQFDNPANPQAHVDTTGPELIRDTEGKLDVFVAGVGTGGTVTGCGRYLKSQLPQVEIVAVEPATSPLLTQGVAGKHPIQGIGANFIPQNFDSQAVDKVLTADGEKAMEIARAMATQEGYLVGISSGAAVAVALELAKLPEYEGKTIVALCPDTGERYLSVLAQ